MLIKARLVHNQCVNYSSANAVLKNNTWCMLKAVPDSHRMAKNASNKPLMTMHSLWIHCWPAPSPLTSQSREEATKSSWRFSSCFKCCFFLWCLHWSPERSPSTKSQSLIYIQMLHLSLNGCMYLVISVEGYNSQASLTHGSRCQFTCNLRTGGGGA